MSGKPRPSPCFLDGLNVVKVVRGRKIWQSADGRRLYTWDSLHGEIEVFTKNGYHMGALDALTGVMIKDAVKGRQLKGIN